MLQLFLQRCSMGQDDGCGLRELLLVVLQLFLQHMGQDEGRGLRELLIVVLQLFLQRCSVGPLPPSCFSEWGGGGGGEEQRTCSGGMCSSLAWAVLRRPCTSISCYT